MSSISQITLPNGNTYELKDAYARQLIAGGLNFVICWDGNSVPVVANIPAGVTVKYGDPAVEYTGTKAASTAEPLTFYLVKVKNNVYTEYVSIRSGAGTEQDPYTYAWESLGDTSLDLSDLGALAYKDNVTINKGNAATGVLGANATFGASVSTSNTNVKAVASGTAVGVKTTDTFVKSYPGATSKLGVTSIKGVSGTDTAHAISQKVTKKLVTTSVPNVTSAGAASDWGFNMGTGADAETLIISGGNGTAPTLGTAITAATGALAAEEVVENVGASVIESFVATEKTLATANSESTTVATGSLDAQGAGASVMTGLGTAVTGSAATSVEVTQQPNVALEVNAEAGAGVVSLASGIQSASVSVTNKDEKGVALYNDLGVSVS